MYKKIFKRVIDIVLSILTLIILSPLIILVATGIFFTSHGPILFVQQRIGLDGRVFDLYKFRSMYKDNRITESEQVFIDSSQVTPIGKFIRRYKIDELAQLINVLKGDMSLVGPRPCLPSLIDDFNETAYYRLKSKPGLSGLAQISGNIFLSWEERWELDKKYVTNITLLNDIKIIFKTILIIIFGEEKYKK